MKRQLIKLVPVAAIAIMLSACSTPGKDKTGSIYMPDMTYSNAYETFSSSDITTRSGDSMSARLPVDGTIPYDYIPNDSVVRKNPAYLMSYVTKNHYHPHDAAKWQEEFDRSGAEIQDPLAYNDENLAEGKRLYNINCSPCHGEKGDGAGQLVELPGGGEGPYTSRPPAYATRLKEVKDGNIFYVVSYGKNMMGGYGYQLSVKERWQVIHYIKSLAGMKGPGTVTADAAAAPAATEAKPKAK